MDAWSSSPWSPADHVDHDRPAEPRPFIGRLVPGSRVARYQILNAIGRGGMGEVYAAYHPDLDRRIALKIVSESGAAAPDRSARLLREARAIAHISHPNVITVYDAGTVDDHVYIAMEFIEGQTLDDWVRAQPRSWREVLDVFIAAGRGLAAAHAAGVVHRDFKPQNVMIGRDGSVRVMDFGLARLDEEPVESDPGVARGEASPLPLTVTKTGARRRHARVHGAGAVSTRARWTPAPISSASAWRCTRRFTDSDRLWRT